jgi:hypothetical protein
VAINSAFYVAKRQNSSKLSVVNNGFVTTKTNISYSHIAQLVVVAITADIPYVDIILPRDIRANGKPVINVKGK